MGQLPPEPDQTDTIIGQLPPEPINAERQRRPAGLVILEPPVAPLPSTQLRHPAPEKGRQAPVVSQSDINTGEGLTRSAPLPSEPITAPSSTPRTATLGRPDASAALIPAQAVERPANPPTLRTGRDPVQEFLQQRSTLGQPPVPPTEQTLRDRTPSTESTSRFGERLGDILRQALGNTADLFKSDHVFDNFISPVTNPFLFEDPRSLTEFRPLFMFQKVPRSQADFRGGEIWFFGGQARLALTDRISLVINKLGGLSINTGSTSPFDGSTGFSELWLGPKYTIIRNDQTGTLLATGLQFQLPIGTRSIYQDTGTLSLMPYLSYGQNLDFGWRIGSLNALVGTGYSFSVTAHRSDFYYLSAQLDLDTFNNHRFYPLTGLNWLIYTANGKERPFFGADGRDLFNLGGLARGKGLLTWAIGARYKISEAAQLGAAFELPVAGPRDFFSYRFTVDFILRY